MSEQDGRQAPALQRPLTNDPGAWKAYWKAQGQEWRTEPEIDEERQKYLAERRTITPDIEQSTYPFKDIQLSRADVEWLLATHERECRLMNWSDDSQGVHAGLDLRGANLRNVNLNFLPLVCMCGGLSRGNWHKTSIIKFEAAAVHLEGASLNGAHLEGALFLRAHLEGAYLRGAHLEGATLRAAHINMAHLEKAHLEGADLVRSHLQGADFFQAHLEGKRMSSDELAYLQQWCKDFPEELSPADLQSAFFDTESTLRDATLCDEQSKYEFVSVADVRWNGVNLAVMKWPHGKQVKAIVLGDEREARRSKTDEGFVKDHFTQLTEYETALRANRQFALALRNQGLNDEADHFAYRAQVIQRDVWKLQQRSLKYTFSWLLDLLAGYGYRPLRSVLWYLVIILGFALAFFAFGHISLLEAFVLSLTSFHGRGFFPGTNLTLSDPRVALAAFEAVVGLLIEISFIATFTQRFFGK